MAVNCLGFEKIAFLYFGDRQTDRQTDEQLHAYVTPLLKKSGLDKNEAGNYRPVSELSLLSKMLKKQSVCR